MTNDIENDINNSIDHLNKELSSLRVGRATPALVENVNVNYYNTPTPLIQLASINATDSKTLVIQPFDKNSIKDIEKSLSQSDIGTSPVVDGNIIRIILPQMTEERRVELVKLVGEKSEKCRVRIRQIREEFNKDLKKQKDAGDLSEDQFFSEQKEVQKTIDEAIEKVKTLESEKEEEIKTI